MIVDFTVENFRSIKEEQILSLHAESKHKHHAGNITHFDDGLGVLKTSVLYGSNAAGKTNLILAFEALRTLMVESGDWKDGDDIKCYDPYLLSKKTADQPTKLELEFYIKNVRYLYKVIYNKRHILSEKLDFYPNSRIANLFTRDSPENWKSVKFGEYYKSGKKQIAFFSNNTYLAKAGNTPDSPEIIREVFNFFRKKSRTVLPGKNIGILGWYNDSKFTSIVNTFLNKVDLGINKFEIEKRNILDDITLSEKSINIPAHIRDKFLEEFSKKEYFYHESDNGDLVRFDSKKESNGTRKLFRMLPFFIKALREGEILFVDEIESSFHPHIAELIIKLFNDPLVNKNNAQLVFTTHDLSLMSSKSMRKDQIYLASKTVEHGTQLDCLDSFDITLKDHSPFAKWYDEGRLGAIPKIDYREISDSIKEAFNNA